MQLKELKNQLDGFSIEDQLKKLVSLFHEKVIFTTSLGIEDQVITHKLFSNNIDVKVITLDTGRLFPQTYDVFSNTIIKYNKKISVYFPEYESVEKMVTAVSYTHLRAHETRHDLVCRLLLEKKK